jgi:hypothetical protein
MAGRRGWSRSPRTSPWTILAEEESILAWALDARRHPRVTTVARAGLDVCADAMAVAGVDWLVLVVDRSAGKTTMLERRRRLHRTGRCSGLDGQGGPVLKETGAQTDTLTNWFTSDRLTGPARPLPAPLDRIVDERSDRHRLLHRLVDLADRAGGSRRRRSAGSRPSAGAVCSPSCARPTGTARSPSPVPRHGSRSPLQLRR